MESSRSRPAPESGRGSARAGTGAGAREGDYDLLTAALIGAVVGASATLLLRPPRRKPTTRRLVADAARAVGRDVGSRAGAPVRKGAAWASDLFRPEDVRDQIGGFIAAARDAIND